GRSGRGSLLLLCLGGSSGGGSLLLLCLHLLRARVALHGVAELTNVRTDGDHSEAVGGPKGLHVVGLGRVTNIGHPGGSANSCRGRDGYTPDRDPAHTESFQHAYAACPPSTILTPVAALPTCWCGKAPVTRGRRPPRGGHPGER